MPNAKDVQGTFAPRILALGNTGAGKSAQFLTLPGKKFVYIFDPNTLGTLRGHDLDYEEFLAKPVSLDIKVLDKDKKRDQVMGAVGSDVYMSWERDLAKKLDTGFFKNYQWIGLDSATTFLEIAMDRVLTINGRPGTFPQQDDWGPQMVAFTNTVRTLTGMGIGIYVTGHLQTAMQDEITQKIIQLPLMTGQLRVKIPLLFSDVFVFEGKTVRMQGSTQSSVQYTIQTVPNQRETPIRTAMRGLKPVEDVTIDWGKPVEGQGLGGIIVRDKQAVR